jgi:hypothetical protein
MVAPAEQAAESDDTASDTDQEQTPKVGCILSEFDLCFSKAIVGDNEDYVVAGDHVLFRFDAKTRKEEREKFAYCLPIHIGQIKRIISVSEVEVWWMYGTSWLRRWFPWRDPKTKKPYTDVMKSSHILQETFGRAAKVTFVTRRQGLTLDVTSQRLIDEVLAMDEYSHSSMAE